MNNKPTLFKRIRNIIVSTIMPRYQEDLWLDISNGEKKAVLKYKGNPLVGGGSGNGNSDYTITKSCVQLTEETLTTIPGDEFSVGFSNSFKLVPGDLYYVTFNGTKYECIAYGGEKVCVVGANFTDLGMDWSEYPFQICTNNESCILYTEQSGTYTVKVEHVEETVEITNDFKKVVNTVTSSQGYTEIHPINLISLPCFKGYGTGNTINDYLSDGYTVVDTGGRAPVYFIVKVTGDNPAVNRNRVFTDCEPVQVPIDFYAMDLNKAYFIPIVTYIINKNTEDVNYGVSTYRGFCGFPGYNVDGDIHNIFNYGYSDTAIIPINGLLGYQFQVDA